MSDYESVMIERIKNGHLVHLVRAEPEGWSPEGERPKKQVMGVELDEQDTWFAADEAGVAALLREHYFAQ